MNRPLGDFQALGQVVSGHTPVGLQQQHNRKQPISAHTFPRFQTFSTCEDESVRVELFHLARPKYDTRCQE
jgi:hypothetical protein